MAQYIDKEKVEEILRNLWKEDDGHNPEHRICYNKALQEVQYELDTLETKEVSSIWNDARKTIPEDSSNKKKIPNQIICIKEDDLAVATIGRLVNGTKKWAYLNDLLNISDVQVKEVDLDNELDFVKDAYYYFTSDERDSMMKVARHFFDLGLNAQKGNGRNN